MDIVSLNEQMTLNFNEYMFLSENISLNEYNFPEYVFLERGYISLNELISSLK